MEWLTTLGTTRLAVVAMEPASHNTMQFAMCSSALPNMPPWLPRRRLPVWCAVSFLVLLILYLAPTLEPWSPCCPVDVSVISPLQHLTLTGAASAPGYHLMLTGAASVPGYHLTLTGAASAPGYHLTLTGAASVPGYHLTLTGAASAPGYHLTLTGAASVPGYHLTLTGAASAPGYHLTLTGAASAPGYHLTLTGAASAPGHALHVRVRRKMSSILPACWSAGVEFVQLLKPLASGWTPPTLPNPPNTSLAVWFCCSVVGHCCRLDAPSTDTLPLYGWCTLICLLYYLFIYLL